jgi:hypothetical protein
VVSAPINGTPDWHPKLRPLSGRHLQSLRSWLTDKLDKGHVIPWYTLTYCVPHLVPKDDGTDRVTIDYTPLNKRSNTPVFRPPDLITSMQEASLGTYFSKIDIVDAYASLAVAFQDWDKFSFIIFWGIFTFIVMA